MKNTTSIAIILIIIGFVIAFHNLLEHGYRSIVPSEHLESPILLGQDISNSQVNSDTNQNSQNNDTNQLSTLKVALQTYETIVTNREPVAFECSDANVVPDKAGWRKYHNKKFQYSIQYPEDVFQIQEFNNCALVEFIPLSSKPMGDFSSIHEYFISFIALQSPGFVESKAWISNHFHEFLDSPDLAKKFQERRFSIGSSSAVEVGPIPGQVDENTTVFTKPHMILEISMYPAPTQPGTTNLPEIGDWTLLQKSFPYTFYQMLDTLQFE